MARRLSGRKLVIASHNAGKLSEIAAMLRNFPVDCLGAAELGLPEPGESGETFQANAELKALAAAQAANLPALADDSGLVVDALGGAPGVYSARSMVIGSIRTARITAGTAARNAPARIASDGGASICRSVAFTW